jgi:hypothetical protein
LSVTNSSSLVRQPWNVNNIAYIVLHNVTLCKIRSW